MSQHQAEISELQCLLRSTQERLQREFETNAEQVHNFYNFLNDFLCSCISFLINTDQVQYKIYD